jgi:membrane protease YdiL (CAAX protease family)
LFLLPLLVTYECGLVWLGGADPAILRNGADTWLHWIIESFGLRQLYWTPLLLAGWFLVWSIVRRSDRPPDGMATCIGMAVESVGFALALVAISRSFGPYLRQFGITAVNGNAAPDQVARAITFVGAGIYEEVLFRLVLFGGLVWLLHEMQLFSAMTLLAGALGLAFLFASAHYAGPYGEPFSAPTFLFRAFAGLYFTALFQWRGFGIAMGTHAFYDVLAGIVMR